MSLHRPQRGCIQLSTLLKGAISIEPCRRQKLGTRRGGVARYNPYPSGALSGKDLKQVKHTKALHTLAFNSHLGLSKVTVTTLALRAAAHSKAPIPQPPPACSISQATRGWRTLHFQQKLLLQSPLDTKLLWPRTYCQTLYRRSSSMVQTYNIEWGSVF